MIEWRKSSRSGATGNTDCVELAQLPGVIAVRDSKHPESGHLALDRKRFSSLVTQVKIGQFDR